MISIPKSTNVPNYRQKNLDYMASKRFELIKSNLLKIRGKIGQILGNILRLGLIGTSASMIYLLSDNNNYSDLDTKQLQKKQSSVINNKENIKLKGSGDIGLSKKLHNDTTLSGGFNNTKNVYSPKRKGLYGGELSVFNADIVKGRINEIIDIVYSGYLDNQLTKMSLYYRGLDIDGFFGHRIDTLKSFMGLEFSLFRILNAIGIGETNAYSDARSETGVTGLTGITTASARTLGFGKNLSDIELQEKLKNPHVSLRLTIEKLIFIAKLFKSEGIISENPYRDILFCYNAGENNGISIYKIFYAMQKGQDTVTHIIDKKTSMNFSGLQNFKIEMEALSPGITNKMNTVLFYEIFKKFMSGKYSSDKTEEVISHYIRIMSVYYKQGIPNNVINIRLLNDFLNFVQRIYLPNDLKGYTLLASNDE